jgi:hypothetical protein
MDEHIARAADGACLCQKCDKPFTPCPYNAARQKFCTRPACVRARKKLSQANWYAEKREDPAFRKTESARVKRAMAHRRQKDKKAKASVVPPSPLTLPLPTAAAPHESPASREFAFIVGLLAHTMDTSDYGEVMGRKAALEARGHRMSATAKAVPGVLAYSGCP